LSENQTIQTSSKEAIHLRNGFYAKSGSIFRGHIEDCTTPFSITENVDKIEGLDPLNTEELNNQLSLNEDIIGKEMQVYPNPFNSEFRVVLETTEVITAIQLVNTLGQAISTKMTNCGTNCFTLESTNLATGMYTVLVKQGREVVAMKKVVKL